MSGMADFVLREILQQPHCSFFFSPNESVDKKVHFGASVFVQIFSILIQFKQTCTFVCYACMHTHTNLYWNESKSLLNIFKCFFLT